MQRLVPSLRIGLNRRVVGSRLGRPMSTAAADGSSDGPHVMNGRELSKNMRQAMRDAVKALVKATGAPPHLAIVTVGERPPAEAMRRQLFASGPGEASWWDKVHGAKDVGMAVTHVKLPGGASVGEVKRELHRLSQKRDVHGVMLEQPLPPHLHPHRAAIWACIAPEKDVDGMTLHNAGRLFNLATGLGEELEEGEPGLRLDLPTNLPTTPLGALEYLDQCGVVIKPGANVVVIGRSKLVGLPLAALLLARNATVSVVHSHTPEGRLIELCRGADVIVATAGIPGQVKPEWVRKGAVVVNVGTTFVPERKELLPDVDRRVAQVASFVTPVPYFESPGKLAPSGGGPMTLPVLLHSTLINAIDQARTHKEKVAHRQQTGCRADTPAVTSAEIANAGLQGWEVVNDGTTLRKTWVVRDFEEAVSLINEFKALAEESNHHPSLQLTDYRRLTVELSSGLPCEGPGSGGPRRLTKFDLRLAEAFDRLDFTPYKK